MATYVNDLRLKEIATGDEAGTWGTSTNTNLELIAEAFSFGTEAITTNANTHTTTIADGSTDPGRSIFLKYTGALDSDCTITIGPNTVSKLWLIENATTDSGSSGPYNIIIKQGTGATVTIPNSHTKAIYSDGAGSGGAMVEAFTDLNLTDTVTISGTTPTLTIGDAGEEDTKIVFDGNAQDFYIGLDDSADDLVIGKGSAVGTTPAIEIDENLDIKFAESIGVGQAASSTTGDIAAQTMSLLGTTPTLTLGDGGEEDVAIKFNGVKDFYIANDDSADKLVIGEGSTVGSNNILTITDDSVTIGDGGAEDTKIVFDGNAQDFHIGLDDSSDDLVIGTGSTLGTNAIVSIDSAGKVGINRTTMNAALHIGAATPVFRMTDSDNDGSAQIVGTDGSLRFDADNENAQSGTNISFKVDNSEAMRIDESGNVGIGTTSPSFPLSVTSASGTAAEFLGESGPHGLRIYGNDGGFGAIGHVSTGSYDMMIDSSGRFGFGALGAASSAQFMRIEAEFSTNRIMRMANRDNSGNSNTLEVGHADNNEGAHVLIAYHGNNTSGASGDPYNDAIMSLQVNGNLAIDGTLSQGSDRRLKKDIANSTYGLGSY